MHSSSLWCSRNLQCGCRSHHLFTSGPSSPLGTILRWEQGPFPNQGWNSLDQRAWSHWRFLASHSGSSIEILLFESFFSFIIANHFHRKFVQFSARIISEEHSFSLWLYNIYSESTMCQALTHATEQNKHSLPSKAYFANEERQVGN